MTKRVFSVMFGIVACLAVACGSKNPTAPSAVASASASSNTSVFSAMALANPTWTGTTTPATGDTTPGGTVTVTFGGTNAITWTNPNGSYTGTVSGTFPSNVIVTAAVGGCTYTATGTVSNVTPSAATVTPASVYTGTYTKTDTASCADKSGSGTFRLTQGAPIPECSDLHPASFTTTGPTWVNYTPAVDTFYVKMEQGSNGARKNACENRGGIYRGDSYDIPGDGSTKKYDAVCQLTSAQFAGLPGTDTDLIEKVTTPAEGIKVNATATFNNAATWHAQLIALPSNIVKGDKTVTLTCGQTFTINGTTPAIDDDLHYESPTEHTTSTFILKIFKNGAQVQ